KESKPSAAERKKLTTAEAIKNVRAHSRWAAQSGRPKLLFCRVMFDNRHAYKWGGHPRPQPDPPVRKPTGTISERSWRIWSANLASSNPRTIPQRNPQN